MTESNHILYKRVNNVTIIEFLIILLFFSVSMVAQTKRALVIGVGVQKDTNWGKINADKDIPYILQMLQNAGYVDVRTLVNEQATKAGIVEEFKNLATKCMDGDVIYIHFSGHGQLITDIDGDEDDGWDESWIAYDSYKSYCINDKGEKHLTDDEINTLVTVIKRNIGTNGKILIVVDACHSGDSSRSNMLSETIRGVSERFEIPHFGLKRNKKRREQWITLSACKDYQLNQEMRMPKVGKLTYALYIAFLKGLVSLQEIEKLMNSYQGVLPQTPVLTGETNKYNISDFLR